MSINWNKVKLVIFDVDGTLYNQRKMRKIMSRQLIGHYLFRPWSAYDLQIIRVFRKERELMCFNPVQNIEEAQYKICADKINSTADSVKKIIDKWMYQAPLKYLRECCYPGIHQFFSLLKQQGIQIAVYSDYPAAEKLQAMELEADLVVSSTDKAIDALKPNPAGLSYILQHFNMAADECLFFGDRDELDGACARKAGMPYYILTPDDINNDYYKALAQTFTIYVN
jgi:putative hydrolase of the HAD superfamily